MHRNREVDSEAVARREERIVLLTLGAVQFTSIVDFMVIMPLGPQLMRSLEIDPAQFGLVVSSYTLAAGLAGLVASSLADRVGRKAAFLSLDAGFLIGTLLCGLAPSYPTLVAARLATGAFGGILGGMAMAIIGDVFPEKRRGRATGALMSAFALASVVGVPFGLVLGTRLGWHAPFLLLAALGTPVLVIAAFVLPPLADIGGGIESASRARSLRDLYAAEPYQCVCPDHHADVCRIQRLSLYQHLPGHQCWNARNELAAGVRGRRDRDVLFSPLDRPAADRYGKLRVFRIVAPVSAVLTVAVANLGPMPVVAAVTIVAALMVTNSGRMVAAMAMITGSVAPERRGGFYERQFARATPGSRNRYVRRRAGHRRNGRWQAAQLSDLGLLSAAATILSLWLAGLVRPVAGDTPTLPIKHWPRRPKRCATPPSR